MQFKWKLLKMYFPGYFSQTKKEKKQTKMLPKYLKKKKKEREREMYKVKRWHFYIRFFFFLLKTEAILRLFSIRLFSNYTTATRGK